MALTYARLAAGFVVAGLVLWADTIVFSQGGKIAGAIYAGAACVFGLAAMTDWLDGALARKLDAVTPLGAALDHAADKVLVSVTLLALAYASLPVDLIVAAIVLIGRDLAVAGLREGLADAPKVGRVGKLKAVAAMTGVTAYLALQAVSLMNGPIQAAFGLLWIGRALIWLAALLALSSAWTYFTAARRAA